jgi:hypothetical protein
LLEYDEQDALLKAEAYSLGHDDFKKIHFEDINKRIDFFLQNAPGVIRDLTDDVVGCSNKPYNP